MQTMHPIFVVLTVVLLASACAAVNCSAGQTLSDGSCVCTSDAGCGNKALFCSATSSYNPPMTNICRECDSFGCDYPSTVINPRVGPVSGASLTQGTDTYADCSASCGCTAHSQCPTGYFCGRSSPNSGANVCRRCSENCYDQIAVDGSCPATSNCAASVQCTIQTQCSSPQYCTGNYKCKSCTTDCYAPPYLRAHNGTYSTTFHTNRLRGGWCPQTCCGLVFTAFDTIRGNTLRYNDPDDIVFLVCNADQYSSSGFSVVVVENTAPESVTASQSSSVSCTLTVDTSPNAATYPRHVPIVRCAITAVDSCEEKNFGLALFGTVAASGAQVRINNFTLHAGRDKDTCGLSELLKLILIIIGVFVALCVIGTIGCCVASATRKPAQPAQQTVVAIGQPVASTATEMQPADRVQPEQGQPICPPQQQEQTV